MLERTIRYWWRRTDGKPIGEEEGEALHSRAMETINHRLTYDFREGELRETTYHGDTETIYAGWWGLNPPNTLPGYFFAVSNDGGKTCVACRERIEDAMQYLEAQNSGGLNDYAIVVVKGKIT